MDAENFATGYEDSDISEDTGTSFESFSSFDSNRKSPKRSFSVSDASPFGTSAKKARSYSATTSTSSVNTPFSPVNYSAGDFSGSSPRLEKSGARSFSCLTGDAENRPSTAERGPALLVLPRNPSCLKKEIRMRGFYSISCDVGVANLPPCKKTTSDADNDYSPVERVNAFASSSATPAFERLGL